MQTNFSFKFGGFEVRMRQSLPSSEPRMTGRLHRLTPEQFDVLVDNFEQVDEFGLGAVRTLTTDNGRTFRTGTINLGGLEVTLYADVLEAEVDPNQIALEL